MTFPGTDRIRSSSLMAFAALAGLALGAGAPDAARADGELNLYSSRHYDTDEQLYTDFEKATGITINRIPDIGRLSETVFHAQGFSGQGVVLTGLAGKIIAEAITGDDSRLKLFEKVRHLPFPGGPLRTPALMAGMGWAKTRDWLGV